MSERKTDDPAWRRERGLKAGRAASAAYRRRRRAKGANYTSKGAAYDGGYRRGYAAAYAWWRRQFLRREAKA